MWNKWFWFTGWNTVYFYLEISMAQLYYGLWRPWYSMILWIVTTLVHNDIMDCDDFGTQWYYGLWRPWYSMISWIVTTLVFNDIMDCDDLGTQWYYGLWRPWRPFVDVNSNTLIYLFQLQLSHDDYDNTLNVHLIQARNLMPKDINGLSDPFVKIYLLPGRW